LWITAVRRRDLRRVVFGRHDLLTPLSAAVAASCAIPGHLAPLRIGAHSYVDGGVHSPTNADLVRRERPV
jgi:NTE family protein